MRLPAHSNLVLTILPLLYAVGFLLAPAGAATPDDVANSAALFAKMATVMQHPRCMNCHTSTDFPRQGDDRHRHIINVSRGPDDRGAAGLHCSTCHQSENQAASGVPGAPGWHLAPPRMAWEGLTVGEICRAISDPTKGAMVPKNLIAHFNTSLVQWAWNPGVDSHGRTRSVPPMTHAQFVALTERWIQSGAACPDS